MLFCAPLCLLSLAVPAQVDRSEKFSESLEATLVTGDVESFSTTPDGAWAVYRASQDSEVPGLYARPTDASTPSILLSEPGVSVGSFALTATGTRAVYLSGPNLFRVGVSGVRVQLNPTLVAGGSVPEFVLDPAGTRAVYRADQ